MPSIGAGCVAKSKRNHLSGEGGRRLILPMPQSYAPNSYPFQVSSWELAQEDNRRQLAQNAARSRAVNANREWAMQTQFTPYGAVQQVREGVQWDPYEGAYAVKRTYNPAGAPGSGGASMSQPRQAGASSLRASAFEPLAPEGVSSLEAFRKMQVDRYGRVNDLDAKEWERTGQYSDRFAAYDKQSSDMDMNERMRAGAAELARRQKRDRANEDLMLWKDVKIDPSTGRPLEYRPYGGGKIDISGYTNKESALAALRSGRLQPVRGSMASGVEITGPSSINRQGRRVGARLTFA